MARFLYTACMYLGTGVICAGMVAIMAWAIADEITDMAEFKKRKR